VSTAALSIVLAPGVLSAAVSPALARATTAAVLPGGAPAAVLALAETAAGGLLTAKAAVASVLLSAGLLVAGLGLGSGHDQAPDDRPERLALALTALPPPEPRVALTSCNTQDHQEPRAAPVPPRRRGFPLAITIARVLIRRLDSEEEHCLVEAELPPGVVLVPVDHDGAWALDLLLPLLAEPALHWQVLDHHERGLPPG
jgi:hypothetical protein